MASAFILRLGNFSHSSERAYIGECGNGPTCDRRRYYIQNLESEKTFGIAETACVALIVIAGMTRKYPVSIRRLWARSLVGVLAIELFAPATADLVRMEDCLGMVASIKTGIAVKVECLSGTERSGPTYEFEIEHSGGQYLGVNARCIKWPRVRDRARGQKQQSSALWTTHQVSKAQARDKVLGDYPGMVKEIEYEIESNGSAIYELDVPDRDGHELR